MRLTKKSLMLVSFTLGTLLLTTTALADIATKSGYDQLKDALKVTAEKLGGKFDSFTFDVSYALKDNGKTLMSNNDTTKFDRRKGTFENISLTESQNGDKFTSYDYSDKTSMITYQDGDQTYYVTEFTKERKDERFANPFKEKSAEDIERIVDAIVGNLKDHVLVTENPDGSKDISGSITEVQIPSLINAVASFQSKQMFAGGHDQRYQMPHLTQDIYVKEVKGTAMINKDGVMESILGTVVLSGKDEQGRVHEVIAEVLAKMTGINSTTVTKPDLTGKKVVKNISQYDPGSEISNPQKYVGKFKNNILIEKDGKFVKVGERIIVIAHFDGHTIAGRYYEEYKPGFEEYATTKRDFEFDSIMSEGKHILNLKTPDSGINGTLYLNENVGGISLDGSTSSVGGLLFDSSFSPDLE